MFSPRAIQPSGFSQKSRSISLCWFRILKLPEQRKNCEEDRNIYLPTFCFYTILFHLLVHANLRAHNTSPQLVPSPNPSDEPLSSSPLPPPNSFFLTPLHSSAAPLRIQRSSSTLRNIHLLKPLLYPGLVYKDFWIFSHILDTCTATTHVVGVTRHRRSVFRRSASTLLAVTLAAASIRSLPRSFGFHFVGHPWLTHRTYYRFTEDCVLPEKAFQQDEIPSKLQRVRHPKAKRKKFFQWRRTPPNSTKPLVTAPLDLPTFVCRKGTLNQSKLVILPCPSDHLAPMSPSTVCSMQTKSKSLMPMLLSGLATM